VARGELTSARLEDTKGGGLVHTAKRLASILGATAILLLLTSCAAPQDEGGPDPGLRGEWELQTATDHNGAIPLINQRISLTIAGDNSTSGRSSCSDYRARVYGSLSTLWVRATVTRALHCASPAQQAIERRYLDALNRVRTSILNGGVLDLLAPGIDLHFQRAIIVPLTLVVGHTWRLTTIGDDPYAATTRQTLHLATGATVRFSPNGEVAGSTGCSSFSGRFTQNAGEIVVSRLQHQLMGRCLGSQNDVDARVLAVLRSGFTFTSAIGELAIASPRAGVALSFID
jgi:heat shock protein HslJ